MSAFKFLLDENLTPRYKVALLRREPKIVAWHIGLPGVPARGTLDPEILEWCETNDFVLVTNNRKSMPVHLRDHLKNGRHMPGILILNDNMTMGETVEELWLIWSVLYADELRDQISFLPLSFDIAR